MGTAARNGLEFMAIYMGPTLVFVGWWFLLRKLLAGRPTRQLDRGGDDPRAVLDDQARDLLEGLLDDVLGAVDEREDRVGRALDPLQEVRVDREAGPVQARDDDHRGFIHPWFCRRARP